MGVYEIMEYTDPLREMVLTERSSLDIERHALQKGMMSLERDATLKVIK